jgi:hypothetical protein
MGLFSILGKAVKATRYQTRVVAVLDAKIPATMQAVRSSGALTYFADFTYEAKENGASVQECADLFDLAIISANVDDDGKAAFHQIKEIKADFERAAAERRVADYRRDVLAAIGADPRWQAGCMDFEDVIECLGETEMVNTTMAESCAKGRPALDFADNMVKFLTDGPMLPIVQAAFTKSVEANIAQRIAKRNGGDMEAARAEAHTIMHRTAS